MQYHYLYHSGILGMHWGVRRYQNPDGTLTPEGRIRYGRGNKARYVKKDGTYRSDESRKEIKKDISYYSRKGSAYGVLGVAAFATMMSAGVAGMPLALIASQGAGITSLGMSAFNNYKSFKLESIKQNADIADFHGDNSTAPEPFGMQRWGVRRR